MEMSFEDCMFLHPYHIDQKSDDLGIDDPLLECVPHHILLPESNNISDSLHTILTEPLDITPVSLSVVDEDQANWCIYNGSSMDGVQAVPQYPYIESTYQSGRIVDSSITLVELLQGNRILHPELSPLKSTPAESPIKTSPTLVKILLSGSNQAAARTVVKSETEKPKDVKSSPVGSNKKLNCNLLGVKREPVAKRMNETTKIEISNYNKTPASCSNANVLKTTYAQKVAKSSSNTVTIKSNVIGTSSSQKAKTVNKTVNNATVKVFSNAAATSSSSKNSLNNTNSVLLESGQIGNIYKKESYTYLPQSNSERDFNVVDLQSSSKHDFMHGLSNDAIDISTFPLFSDDGQQAAIEAFDVNSLLEEFENATAHLNLSPVVMSESESSLITSVSDSNNVGDGDASTQDLLEIIVSDGSNYNTIDQGSTDFDMIASTVDIQFKGDVETQDFSFEDFSLVEAPAATKVTDKKINIHRQPLKSNQRHIPRKISLSQYRTRIRPTRQETEAVVQHMWGVLPKAEAEERERLKIEELNRQKDELLRIQTDHDYCLPVNKAVQSPGQQTCNDQSLDDVACAVVKNDDKNPALKALLLDENLGREMREQAIMDRKVAMENMDSSRKRHNTICDVIDMDIDDDQCVNTSQESHVLFELPDELSSIDNSTLIPSSESSLFTSNAELTCEVTLASSSENSGSVTHMSSSENSSFTSRRGRKSERNYRSNKKSEDDLIRAAGGLCMDKLPNYMTALSIPNKASSGKLSVVRAVHAQQFSSECIERDPSPNRIDSQLFSKLPSYHNCFTNSTKYDSVDSLSTMAEPEDGLWCEPRSEPPSSNNQSPISMHDVMSSPNDIPNSVKNRGKRQRSHSSSSSCSSCSSESNSNSRNVYARSKNPSKRFRNLSRERIHESNSNSMDQQNFRLMSEKRQRQRDEEDHERQKLKQMEERKIVYVGGIPDNYTHKDLQKKFECFGAIVNISVHFRQHGDNYGFVTFKYACDAFAMIEKGRAIRGCENFDFCFGGRRHFCKNDYADLDGNKEEEEELMTAVIDFQSAPVDFDSLLQQAQRSIGKRVK